MLTPGCTNRQSVIIDDVIKVTVLHDKRGHVVPGIDAPDGIEVRCEEVDPRIQKIERPRNVNV